MKRFAKTSMVFATLLALSSAGLAPADPPAVIVAGDQPANVDHEVRRDKKFHCCKAEKLIGKTVKNRAGKDIGTIKDLALDPQTGRVVYGVLSFGGFIGLGEKLFAIPWSAFEYDEDKTPILNVTKDQLEASRGFDADKWPNMADGRWADETYSSFGQKPYWAADRNDQTTPMDRNDRNTMNDVNNPGNRNNPNDRNYANNPNDPNNANRQIDNVRPATIARATTITGTPLKNSAGEDIGTIDDLVLDCCQGRVAAAVVRCNAVLGMGGESCMVPWKAFTVTTLDNTNVRLTSNLTKEQVTSAPKMVDDDEYQTRPDYLSSLYRHYNVQPYWSSTDPTYQPRTRTGGRG
ncbi:MAG: PRC-barrel domain-containing protein [Phycisphaerae bacterium]|nr:PRC-barrel domain-containing protein [Phycisphaerae bacterium]